jgi:predicted phage tail protein
MKIVGVLLAVVGWLLPVLGVTMTSSLGVRYVLCFLGIAITLTGIIAVLNRAHLKDAVWKK